MDRAVLKELKRQHIEHSHPPTVFVLNILSRGTKQTQYIQQLKQEQCKVKCG